MFSLNFFVTFLILCSVHGSLSKPLEHNYNEGRGIGSTIWGWLTYPFTWWSSGNDILPESDKLVRSTTIKPFETIEIGKHNVTIWCNDQTCTTMKCDRFGCVNISCNIYDTDLNGECREYNTLLKPEDPTSQKPTGTSAKPVSQPTTQDKEIRTTAKTSESTIIMPLSPTESYPIQTIEERPLELEAVLSSTVTEVVSQSSTIKPNN